MQEKYRDMNDEMIVYNMFYQRFKGDKRRRTVFEKITSENFPQWIEGTNSWVQTVQ